ncbi:LPS-assembly protein LptD [Thiobacter aerophilum]|uniref:LPS-assembly protein LptD n=1 Tax=Thiobacter aerophilum TaxID=3121275 RepID=A0ABV0EHI3_9BURK
MPAAPSSESGAVLAPPSEPLPLALTPELPRARPPAEGPTPVFVRAREIRGHQDREVEAEGDVEVRKLGITVNADRMTYDLPSDTVSARGNVRVQTDNALARGPELSLHLETQTGHMTAPRYMLAQEHARGEAAKAEFLGEDRMRLTDASYTTCGPGQDDWFIRAGELYIDRSANEGVARHARVEFMDVPLLYTPWISFPLSRARKSGLLAPSFGTTGNSGAELTLPYYWNIAPNYDATLTPRFMQKRGLQLGGEFRYLMPGYGGTLQAEYLAHDRVTDTNRSRLSVQHQQQFGNGLAGALNLQRVSDDNYFRDLSTLVAQTSQNLLPREGLLTYGVGGLSVLARVQRFQVLQDPLAPIIAPYNRQPQVNVAYSKLDFLGTDLRFTGEYADFRSTGLVSGRRFVIYPSVSLPLAASWGYFTPKAGVHYTRYSLDQTTLAFPDATGTVRPYASDATRTLPILSLDTGLVLERQAGLFGQDMLQTLEPRLYYLYVPYKDQSRLPSFDSAEADFNFAQIFSENRFSGQDRVSDANQLTVALTSRWLEPITGQERLRAMLGQRLSFRMPQVTLINAAPKDRRSDFLASLGGLIAPGWSLDSAWEYNPNLRHTQRYNLALRYAPQPGQVANFTYRFNRNDLRQLDASAQWPLAAQWHGVARWNYSLQDRRLLEGIAGVEYNKGCWAVRLVAHRFTTATQHTTNALFVQLELAGASSLGSNPLSLLRQSIAGFTPSEPQLGTYNLEDY